MYRPTQNKGETIKVVTFQISWSRPSTLVRRGKVRVGGSAARDPHGIKQITVGPPHGIKQITMFIRENVECLDSSFTTTTAIKEVPLVKIHEDLIDISLEIENAISAPASPVIEGTPLWSPTHCNNQLPQWTRPICLSLLPNSLGFAGSDVTLLGIHIINHIKVEFAAWERKLPAYKALLQTQLISEVEVAFLASDCVLDTNTFCNTRLHNRAIYKTLPLTQTLIEAGPTQHTPQHPTHHHPQTPTHHHPQRRNTRAGHSPS
ncbi:hypothetical protein J6590_086591 [Homalodisca vitripennis]|nr:hypothetical protein J6590_086591 [Homalodisca vitripennis]